MLAFLTTSPRNREDMMKPIVYLYHVEYAKTATGAAAIMDNVRQSGVDDVKATWDKDAKVYRIEYRTERVDTI